MTTTITPLSTVREAFDRLRSDLSGLDPSVHGEDLAAATEMALDDLEFLEGQLVAALDALEKGKRFERAYQESLGATWTLPQKERLDSLQSAFLDAYLEVLP